jgi:hypothetical protein
MFHIVKIWSLPSMPDIQTSLVPTCRSRRSLLERGVVTNSPELSRTAQSLTLTRPKLSREPITNLDKRIDNDYRSIGVHE